MLVSKWTAAYACLKGAASGISGGKVRTAVLTHLTGPASASNIRGSVIAAEDAVL